MTTNWRALCAELTDELADFQWAVIEAGVGWACPDTEALIDRARAALARGGHPAPVPVSEPIAWLWEYIGSDPYPHKFSPVARSLREMDPANPPFPDDWRPVAPLYLARWGHQPAPPAEGEVADEARYLARELRDQADDMSPALELFGLMHRAAELLAQRHPAPVPVAERRISCWPRLPELRGMFERILCVARSSGQRPVGHIELADRLISAVVSWAALPLPATTRDIESND